MSLPVVGANESVITVKTAGLRDTLTSVAVLQGVTLKLYDGGDSGPAANATPRSEPWATCVSDIDGDCNFIIPDTQVGGANYDARFWVRQALPHPNGYHITSTLAIGTNPASVPYQFRTGTQLRGSTTYSSLTQSDFMYATGNTNTTASGGIWPSVRDNPATPQQCGLDVALVLDISGSVSPFINNLKAAANHFVDSLTGTPSSVALYTFAADAPAAGGANLGKTAVSTQEGADTVKDRINSYTSGGGTNWDRGLYQVAQAATTPANTPDIAVVITDGNPTYYAQQEGPGNRTRFREVENGIFSANAIKDKGIRVLAMGVGEGIDGAPDNLRAISGPIADSDYYQSEDYEEAGNVLRDLALGNCAGSVTVVKQLVSSAGTGEDISNPTPAGGWEFTAVTSTSGVTPATHTDQTAVGTGAVNFPLTFAGGVTSGDVTVGETQQAGHTLVTQNGQRAVCTNVNTNDPVSVQNDPNSATGFTVTVPSTAAISCNVYNRPEQPTGNIVVHKLWSINNTPYTQGNQPLGFNAQLSLDDEQQNWSTPKTGIAVGTTVPISEETSFPGRDLCTVTSSKITDHNGDAVDISLPYNATITAGDTNEYTITNVVTCTAELTLVKQVQGGSADPASWTLGTVTPTTPTAGIPGPTGASGTPQATGPISPGLRYVLTETGGSGLYTQTLATGANPTPPAEGSWQCVQVNAGGAVIPGFADGANGGITAPLGYRVRCTAVNQTSSLTLIKQVTNDNGGTKVPGDWTLTATPTGTVPGDVVAQSVDGSLNGNTINVRPSTTYTLNETGPDGYTRTSLKCNTGPLGTYVDTTSVSVDPLANVTCIYVNDDESSTLTLVKAVDPGSTGVDTPATAWTLKAVGPTTIEGVTESDDVTGKVVDAGTYALSETGGPAGYTPSEWLCTGGTLTGSNVVVPNGADVVCTITNTAQSSVWEYTKTSDPAPGSVIMPGQEVTYTITAKHMSGVAQPNVILLDDLADVLDNAEIIVDPVASTGTADLTDTDLVWFLGELTGTQTLTYTVKVNADAYGVTLRNIVTSFFREECAVAGGCETEHGTPAWNMWKTSDPASGATIAKGAPITYTLHAQNTSAATMPGAVVTDDLTDVLDGGTLQEPLAAGLSFDPITRILTWQAPDLVPDAEPSTVSYQVVVSPQAAGTLLNNVAKPGPGGECREEADCDTTHRVPDFDLAIAKTHTPLPEGAVDAGQGDTVDYTVTVSNPGPDPALNPTVTDTLPEGLTYVADSLVLPTGWTGSFTGQVLTATYTGSFAVDATAGFTYTALVGNPPRTGPTVPYEDLVNTACVDTESDDSNAENDCATDTVEVKSVDVEAAAVCRADTPWASYSVTPTNVDDAAPIALIWWTEEAFADRDPSIDASDSAALLADGASQVDVIDRPADWEPGDAITGEKLWPGAAVDDEGNPIAWPGWTELPDGSWILDPDAPFYELRGAAVLEVRVNPSTADTLVYPPATPNCHARPPQVDLDITKVHADLPEGAVDAGKGDTIDYTIAVANRGPDAAVNPVVTDTLPQGLTYVADSLVLPTGWTGSFSGQELTATFAGDFAPEATATFTYKALVGEPPRSGPTEPYANLVNTACVETDADTDPENNCATDTIKVKSVLVEASAVCRSDTPWASYSVTPVNLEGTPPIALIWWTEEAFADRDPSIAASDTAALLADGASQVDPIELPAGWTPGTPITGEKLWPGAAVDDEGNPIAWPGWTQLDDGTWILDPEAPFYNLRGAAVMEVRINPSTADTLVYPPATPNCNAAPPAIDLGIVKTHSPIPEGAVDAGRDQTIDYTVTVSNDTADPAANPVVTDTLPQGLTYVADSLELPTGWTGSFSGQVLTATFVGDFAPGTSAQFTYTALVGDPPRSGPTAPYGDLVNTACVETRGDVNPDNDCATDTVKVKSVTVEASAVCRADTPWATYTVTPINMEGTPPIALIWWTEEAFANRDPSIAASDTAALLADGASQVDPIEPPAGWQPGDPITGEKLWPGAAIDDEGNPIAWPGWTELDDGTWILDPDAPFYNLRGAAVMEVRINPSTAETLVYPPATPNCTALPPVIEPPTPSPSESLPFTPPKISVTGPALIATIAGLALAALALGGIGIFVSRRNREERS